MIASVFSERTFYGTPQSFCQTVFSTKVLAATIHRVRSFMRRVKYKSIRPTVRSGDVLAFEANTFIGRMISLWTGSHYAHVGIAMWLVASGAEP